MKKLKCLIVGVTSTTLALNALSVFPASASYDSILSTYPYTVFVESSENESTNMNANIAEFNTDEFTNKCNSSENTRDKDSISTTEKQFVSVVPYVLLSENNTEIYSDSITAYGSIKSNGSVSIFSNNQNIYGDIQNHAEDFAPGEIERIMDRNNTVMSKSGVEIYENNPINKPLVCTHLYVYCPSNLIMADVLSNQNICICSEKHISDDCLLVSKKGNITINSNETEINGIVYAPNGTVTINSDSLKIKGIIIAKKIIIHSNRIRLCEDQKAFDLCEQYADDVEEQNNLIEEYENVKAKIKYYESINDDDTLPVLYDEYRKLHDIIDKKGMFMKENEIRNMLPTSVMNKTNTSQLKALKYPLQSDALDKKFDVIRSKGTRKYNGKTYQYYSVSVSDKNSTNYFFYEMGNKIIMHGKVKDLNAANKFLNKTLEVVIPAGTTSLFKNPFAGKVVGSLVKKILAEYNKSKYNPADFVIKNKNTYEITALTVETSQKYTFVLDGSTWYNVFNCNRAIWNIEHSFYKYQNGKLNAFHAVETLKTNGDYFKSYKAVQYYVENANMHNGKYTNVSLNAYRTNFIGSMKITDSSGKKWVIPPINYPTTTSLISII